MKVRGESGRWEGEVRGESERWEGEVRGESERERWEGEKRRGCVKWTIICGFECCKIEDTF